MNNNRANVSIANHQVAAIASALRCMDGNGRLGEPGFTPFRYPNPGAMVPYKLARNLRLCKEHLDLLEDTRVRMVNELTPDPNAEGIDAGTPAFAEFQLRYRAVLQQQVQLPLWTIRVQDLNLDANPIPPSIIEALIDILEYDEHSQPNPATTATNNTP